MKKKYTQIIEIEECKQAVRIARISSRKQERGASLEAQEQIIKEYCEKNKLKIIEPYEKAFIFTESSTRGGRKKFYEMIDFIEKQKHKTAIVVHTLDRLQRGFDECTKIKQLLKDDKIEVHFIHESLILNKFSSDEDFTRYDFGILAAKMYLTAMNKNVKRCQKYNREAGMWQCMAKIGYLNISKTSKSPATLILDPDRAPIIKQIFEEYATGVHSLKSIWLSAKEKGLMSKEPNYNPRSKNFGKICPISRNKIHDILTDPFYYGYTFVACEELDERTQKPIRTYYKLIKHIYEPIISKELFDRVQAILTGNGNHNRNNTTEYAKTPYTFRGLIHCKECGCLITPEKKVKKNGNTYIYLRCGHPCKECHQGIVNENVIIEQLKKEVMDKISLPPKLQEIVKEKLTQELNDTSAFNKTMKTNITKQLNELKVKDDNLLDYYLEGGLPKETYEEKHKQITNQRAELEQTAEKYKNIDADMKKRVVQVMALANNISKLFDMATPTRRNELLQLLISNCHLNGSILEYTINAPFNWLVDSNNYTEWTTVVIQHLDDFECVKV